MGCRTHERFCSKVELRDGVKRHSEYKTGGFVSMQMEMIQRWRLILQGKGHLKRDSLYSQERTGI